MDTDKFCESSIPKEHPQGYTEGIRRFWKQAKECMK